MLDYLRNPKAPITFDSFTEEYQMHGRQMNKDRGWNLSKSCL